jgi:hypothetical protein
MAAQTFTLKDPFRATTEFRFQELESFIHITQQACEEVARQEKGDLEAKISRILKENPAAKPEAAHDWIYPVAECVHTHHEAMPRYLSYTFIIQVYCLFEELAKDLHAIFKGRESIPGFLS